MRPLIVLCFILLLFNNWNLIEAQIPIIQWQGVYGGTENEEGLSVIVKTDSTIIIAGSAESSNGIVSNHHHPTLVANDIWLIQLTNSGQVIWNKCFGGASDDEGHAIKLDNDNGYVFCGLTGSNDGDVIGGFHGYVDAWVVKIDSNAIIQWQKCFGGTQNDYANDVIQTSDSGYLVTGLTSSPDGDGIGYHGGGVSSPFFGPFKNGVSRLIIKSIWILKY